MRTRTRIDVTQAGVETGEFQTIRLPGVAGLGAVTAVRRACPSSGGGYAGGRGCPVTPRGGQLRRAEADPDRER